jgi:dTDP-4-dehydrorhamnose reductase
MPKSAMRIFVAGEHGQVAEALGSACVGRGHTFQLAGRGRADLINRTMLGAAVSEFRPDLVVNAAAYTAVDKAEDEAERAFRLNRDGAENVAAGAAAARAPLIHLSTDYVYDGAKQSPYVETDAPRPIGVYGASKLAGESAIAAIGGDSVILRTSWVCSPSGDNFVKTMLRLATQRDEIGVVDDQWGAPTFAADLAEAIVSIGEFLVSEADRSAVTGIYHICGSGHTTRCRFARAIMQDSAQRGGPSCRVRAITTQEYPTRAKRPANSRLDCSKLARVFGIRLPPWEASLGCCLDQLIATPQRAST